MNSLILQSKSLQMVPYLIAAGSAIGVLLLYRRIRAIEEKLLRRQYKPDLILLLRHGESEANVDPAKYGPGQGINFGDPNVRLTEKGRAQATQAGRNLAAMLGGRTVSCFVSPYERTRETAKLVCAELSAAGVRILRSREDPRIREREFCGSFQRGEVDRSEEASYSRFFWRPERGESCADVYDRVTAFIDTLWRDVTACRPEAVLVVSHGLTNRLLLMRWLHWTPETFAESWNPGNCDVLTLQRQPRDRNGHEYYRLTEDSLGVLQMKHRPDAAESLVACRPKFC